MPTFLNLLRFFSRIGLLNDDNKLARNYFADYSNPVGRAASMSETTCNGFEPQTYLKDRCKHCFRVRSKHDDRANTAAIVTTVYSLPSTAATSPVHKKERRKSWREKPQNPDEGPEQDDAGDCGSVASFKSANSKGLSSAKSLESVTSASNFDTRSMVTAVSGSIEYDDRAMTPTSTEPDDVRSLKLEVARLQDQIASLKEERQRWTLRKEKKETGTEESLMEMLEEKLLEAENCIQDYRDENTVLKCELRELQESGQTYSREGDTPLEEKLRATEQLCDEMLTENEALKAESRDLQQEIEEMQDQYREEEIEEFRDLQRELEQNAKNCRILQFKLRKSERLREEAEAERNSAEERLRSIVHLKDGDEDGLTTSQMNTARVRELESELRIAKEVSVRLHVELESTEEKRCKLEDEVFYLNEKVRELQTHRKWREARAEREKRLSAELPMAVVPIISESTPKEMRDLLERENDLKEQLKYAEDDQKRTRARLHDLENENEELLHKLANLTVSGKLGGRQRPPMTRSASEGNTHLQLELATSEVEHLTAQVSKLEQKNANLTKKLLDIEIESRKSQEGKMNGHVNNELERDISKLMSRITELEKNNAELISQLKRQSDSKPPSGHRLEHEQKIKSLETEVAELKQLLGKTDNQKLISMATKAEVLSNQLMIANDRINALHKRAVRESKAEDGYAESLKQRCDHLEKQISEAKAVSAFSTPRVLVPCEDNALASVAEIEQCCVVLASVETQTSRICKQIEKMDNAQKDERRRSLTKDSSATIIAELANVMYELKSVHSLLEAHKLNNPTYVRRSPDKDELAKCKLCEEKETFIDSQREDIIFYKKKNKELTNQLLQTEDRWSVEMEKQRQTYETEIKTLQCKVTDALRQMKEQQHILESKSASLTEKVKMIQEKDAKCEKLANEVREKHRFILDIEKEQKNLKEFETRYRKLESLYTQEKEKYNADRAKTKSEMASMKKRCEETHLDLDKLRDAHQRREILWNTEREKLEKNIDLLREQLGKDDDGKDKSASISLPAVSYTYKRVTNETSSIEQQNTITTLKKKIASLEEKVGDLRLANEELTSDLTTTKLNWERDKENMQHKLRQDEKIRGVEFEALQEKFASRMNIMENTNKSLHTQLVQTRRERDHHKEAVNTYEKRVEEERKRMELDAKHYANLVAKSGNVEKKLKEFEDEIDRLKRELRLAKEAHSADKKLWIVEKTHINSKSDNSTISSSDDDKDVRITENALKAAESVQKQYIEYQRFYDREVDRLKSKIKELTNDAFTKEFEYDRAVKQLREQIKVLEIDQRNLVQAKDMQCNAREASQVEQERLQQAVQLAEVQKLTRKYKVSAAIEQLKSLIDGTEKDTDGTIRGVVGQLGSVRDDDSQTLYSPTDTSGIYDIEQPSDTVSQSSMSIKSSPFPVNSATSRWTNHSNTITPNRSFSIESNATWEPRSHSPVKKLTAYPDPPPNFILNTDKTVEYDKDGRLHYVPKSIARSASYDRYGLENNGVLAPPPPKVTLTDDEEGGPVTMMHSRTNSTGTNILYKIRREELAKGSQPTVRQMAKAFDMMDSKPSKRGLFSIRKSRSVETTETARNIRESSKNALVPGVPSSVLHRNTTSLSQIDDRILPTSSSSAAYTTLPRGGRNPFKNMGTKIVERVRRSLSRTSVNRRSEDDESLHERNSVIATKSREAIPATPVKTKTKIKKTVRKQPAPPTSPPPSTPPDRKLKSTVISSA